MARRLRIQLALICVLTFSGCVLKSGSGLSITPFAKNSASYTAPKKPLTQFALDAMKSKKKKDNSEVRIVSPLDWFRNPSSKNANVPKQLSADEMTKLTAQYEAAVAEKDNRAARPLGNSGTFGASLANNLGSATSRLSITAKLPRNAPIVPNTSGTAFGSQVGAGLPSGSLAQGTPTQRQQWNQVTPTTMRPIGSQPVAVASYPATSYPATSYPETMSQSVLPRYSQPVAFDSPSAFPSGAYPAGGSQPIPTYPIVSHPTTGAYAAIAPATIASQVVAPPRTSPGDYNPANQPSGPSYYPSTGQQSLPNAATALLPSGMPVYR